MPPIDNSHKDLRTASLQKQNLANVTFAYSDLRGADLSDSTLTSADFSHAKTGITLSNTILIFIFALLISVFSGYIAMLAGTTIEQMVNSSSQNIRVAGIVSLVTNVLFIAISIWKGVGNAVSKLIIPVTVLAVIIGVAIIFSGAGSGEGVMYLILSLVLVVVMFVVGTVARAAAGSLSNILFVAVALTGGMFGRTVGGGIGTIVMAVACALISKRALKGSVGFESLTKIAFYVIRKFGTSFRNTKLTRAHFEGANIRNTDFSGADISSADWTESVRSHCLIGDKFFSDKAGPQASLDNVAPEHKVV